MTGGTQPAFSDAAAAFLAYWRSLRHADLVPQSSRFLDCADPRFQPYLSFNDIDPGGENVVSLMGTMLAAMMQKDWTGMTTASFLPAKVAENLRQDLTMCAVHPCGMWETAAFVTSAGRAVSLEILTLPLRMGASQRIRAVRYHRQMEEMEPAELMTQNMRWKEKHWVDIGAGSPSRPPHPSAMP